MGKLNSNSSKYVVFGMITCVSVFLAIFFYIPGEGPSELDRAAEDWIAGVKGAGWTKMMQAAAVLGESTAIIELTLLLTAAAVLLTGFRKSLWIIPAVAVTYLVNSVLKAWIGRPRPAAAWGIEADGFSFPSGNAMLAVVLYGMFAVWMGKYGRIGKGINTAIGWAAVLVIVLIGWSRLYFSVHYLTDILGGYTVGGLILLLLLMLDSKMGKQHRKQDIT